MLFWLRKQKKEKDKKKPNYFMCFIIIIIIIIIIIYLSPLYAQPASLHFLGKWNFMEKINTHTKTSLHLSVWL